MDILYFGILLYISPAHGLLHHCAIVTSVVVLIYLWMLYLWLLRHVCVLHTMCSLVALHLGNIVMYIYGILFFIPLSSSSLTCVQKSGLTYRCWYFLSYSLKYITLFLVYQYLIYLFLLETLSVGFHLEKLFTLNLLHPKKCMQHHLYTVF